MTNDQIAELGRLATDLRERNLNLRHAAGIEALTRGEPTPADSLLRLLEERRRLLEVASALMGLSPAGPLYRDKAAELRAAIAFAEEESK